MTGINMPEINFERRIKKKNKLEKLIILIIVSITFPYYLFKWIWLEKILNIEIWGMGVCGLGVIASGGFLIYATGHILWEIAKQVIKD